MPTPRPMWYRPDRAVRAGGPRWPCIPDLDGAWRRLSVSPVERSWLAVATRVPSGLNATVRTFRPWRSGDPRGWPVEVSHRRAIRPPSLVSTVFRSGLYTIVWYMKYGGNQDPSFGSMSTVSFRPSTRSRRRDRPLPISQTRAVISAPADTAIRPSGLIATQSMASRSAPRGRADAARPVAASHK